MKQEMYELFLNLKNGLHSKINMFNKMLDTIQKEKRIIEGEKTFNSFDEWLTSHILFFGNDVIYRAKRLELDFGNPDEFFLFFPKINKIDRDYIAILDKIGAQIINLAREHQTGRALKIGAFATFDFTEGGIFSYTTFFIFCK